MSDFIAALSAVAHAPFIQAIVCIAVVVIILTGLLEAALRKNGDK